MNAFVLSGGANLGAVQAGMLEALFEAGAAPEIIVGTSIGAANAAFIAGDPTLKGARALSEIWRDVRPREIFPIRPVRITRALVHGDALFPVEPWRRFLETNISYGRIDEAKIPLRIVATHFEDGRPAVFESGPVIDAVLASTALPGVFPPHEVDGRLYLDGGLADHVPITPAVEAGADTVYILSVGFPCPPPPGHPSARAVLLHSIGLLLSQRIRLDGDHLPQHNPALRIVQLPPVCAQVGLRDFSRSAELIASARSQTAAFLESGAAPCCGHETTKLQTDAA